MCGISGFYCGNSVFSEEDLRQMTDCLEHRGPDASGFFMKNGMGFGHRRLSIIDLSEKSNQPIHSSDGRYVICYNGEVYNFKELIQAHLPEHEFRSTGDTEVVLEGFAKYGPEFVENLIGMFAFSIYDNEKDELYVFRDRLGIKPLYYFWDNKDLAFASELKSLQKIKKLDLQIRNNSVKDFLHLGYIPAPFSIYHNIYKLESGSYLKINKDGLKSNRYWNVREKIRPEVISEEKDALDQLTTLMESSVSYRMYSDVELGVFLSGGIDSSTVAATASALSSKKIKTYSIGFKEEQHDESPFAKAVADKLDTDHHEFKVSINDALKLIPQLTDCFDEPFADSSAIPTMIVSKMASQHVKVVLSGDGGDELFFGYGAHLWAQRLHKTMYKALRKPASILFNQMSSRYQRVADLLDYDDNTDLSSHIFSQEQYLFSRKEIERLCIVSEENNTLPSWGVQAFIPINEDKSLSRELIPEEQQAMFDLQLYLQDDLLVKVDRASMKYSLETRVPILDHRLVEFAINLDPSLKIKDGSTKYLLKQYLFSMLPQEMFDRPKRGFSVPLSKWLKHELSSLIDETLSKDTVNSAGLVDFAEVQKLINDFRGGKDHLYNRIWLLIVLHSWYYQKILN
ncbi:MAG: asparagine synthase (glutamine-hydrolyzing) [Bacteroidia bacterium]|nr:asparagine synthase (glutamine-hydrolyzing) [Bacteroidia bacterium]